jgi:hypothetical protein
LEATVAASASRVEDPSDAVIDVWARRVFIVTAAMRGPAGDLIRHHRGELAATVDSMMFEATGGDAGQVAVAAGLANTYVPQQVARAQALAMGRKPPAALVREASAAPQRVASASTRAPAGNRVPSSSTASRSAAASTPTNTAPREGEQPRRPTLYDDDALAQDQTRTGDEPMVIKVYKLRKQPSPRAEP